MSEFLWRYTNIPALIGMLRQKRITLLDPSSWQDRNDSYYLSQYREKNDLKAVMALCFTEVSETFHHWRVFADGSSGVCIRFDKKRLLSAAMQQKGVKGRYVKYLTLEDIRRKKLKSADLPFLKRYGYGDEREYRLIYESATEEKISKDIAIPLNCINRITLSPWLPNELRSDVVQTLNGIQGCKRLEIVRSTLISNKEWRNKANAAK